MKNIFVRLALSGALALSIAITAAPWAAHAQPTKFPSYTSGVQVQNLESTAAQVTLTAYNDDGSVDATIGPATIAGNDSETYFPLGVSEGFQGSMVISSDKKVAAIANILNSSFTAGASYVAADQGATTVQLPLLMRNNSGFTTWYAVQNTGSTAATVNISYSDGTSVSEFTLQPNAARVIYQDDEAFHTQAVFSAIIESTQPVVASVIEENSATMFAYSGFTGGSVNPVMPLINANNAGYVTGVQIQNTGTTDTNVTVAYTPSSQGTPCTETQSIPAGASRTFALLAFNDGSNSNCAGGATFVGSAKVTGNSANQPLAAIVNQLGPGTGEAYNGFNPAEASERVVMPLIMDRNGGYFTGFNVQNVGSAATSVSCTFTGGVSYSIPSTTLQPDQALTDLQFEKIAPGYVGSATCTATSGGQIVAVVNELSQAGGDQFLVYEGTNTTP